MNKLILREAGKYLSVDTDAELEKQIETIFGYGGEMTTLIDYLPGVTVMDCFQYSITVELFTAMMPSEPDFHTELAHVRNCFVSMGYGDEEDEEVIKEIAEIRCSDARNSEKVRSILVALATSMRLEGDMNQFPVELINFVDQ